MDESLHILDIAVLLFPDIVRFIVADPDRTGGKKLDLMVIDVFIDAPCERFSFDRVRILRMKVDGKVFYEELNGLSVSNASDFIKTLILRRSGLIEDLHELG